jgi:hypothetical protein
MTISADSRNRLVAFGQGQPLTHEVAESVAGNLPRRGHTADIGLR